MNKFNSFIDRNSSIGPKLLRTALGLVFIYFGYSSFTSPQMWVDLVPSWTSVMGSAEMLVKGHGIVEMILGLLLILGMRVRIVASLLFLDLVHILTLLDFGSIWMRDFGLAGSMLSLVFSSKR